LNEGPRSAGWLVFKWLLVLIVAVVVLGIFSRCVGWFGEASQVASEQFGARAMLEKYEWFKDASAQLDKLDADIHVYEARRAALIEAYGDTPRTQWPRDDRQEWSLIASEVAGVKAGYNGLAAQYNAQMSKFNYAFTNAGQLPQGADRILPREYRAYQTSQPQKVEQ
jgi:hypothetical protein